MINDAVIMSIVSLFALMLASEFGVKAIISLARHYGFSTTFAGLTILSITTSLPEIVSHLIASAKILTGSMDYKIASATVLGANIGSDVIQQTFVVGLVVLLMGGLTFKKKFLTSAYLPMIGTTLMCIILGWDGHYSRPDGLILLLTFAGYLLFLYHNDEGINLEDGIDPIQNVITAGFALTIMIICAHFFLMSSEKIVEITGLGGSLIGVVSLGVASATPELFTALSGLRQKDMGISLGTLIGSNITNPLLAIGGGALISTYWVPKALVHWDLAMETITAALLLMYLLYNKGKLSRWGAYYLIGLYFFYLFIRIKFFAFD